MGRLKRDLFELLLGIGILALGLVVILFTFTQAFAIATNPGEWIQGQVPQTEQPVGPTGSFDWASNSLTVTFTDTSRPGDAAIVSWDWDFGDGQGSNAQSPEHSYPSNSVYNATLVVRDANGIESLAFAQVTAFLGETRSGRGMTNPFGEGLSIDFNVADMLLPVATVLLTFGLFLVMATIGGKIMMAGWSILKPKPETIRVRLKPKLLTQAIEDEARGVGPPPPAT